MSVLREQTFGQRSRAGLVRAFGLSRRAHNLALADLVLGERRAGPDNCIPSALCASRAKSILGTMPTAAGSLNPVGIFAGLDTSVLSIPTKRVDRRLILAVSRPEIQAILVAPDLSTRANDVIMRCC
ncbi:hypothetical protein C9I57_30465 [Trinickia symbiotica]|uniref:Uncharacterized protein n=1 Tax=Trinickia symbiotica TaxID=863227 RepID=A0A2T3XKH5_9BURK|nr:hypothetical protein C9I57_30465 [Trinickia symbiotica]